MTVKDDTINRKLFDVHRSDALLRSNLKKIYIVSVIKMIIIQSFSWQCRMLHCLPNAHVDMMGPRVALEQESFLPNSSDRKLGACLMPSDVFDFRYCGLVQSCPRTWGPCDLTVCEQPSLPRKWCYGVGWLRNVCAEHDEKPKQSVWTSLCNTVLVLRWRDWHHIMHNKHALNPIVGSTRLTQWGLVTPILVGELSHY